jgi:prephenate dehydratase
VDRAHLRVGYFGPAGTFTEQALLTQGDLAAIERVAYRTVPDVLDAVERGEVHMGFVPIENSIEGTVNFTQDALVFDHDLLIQREVVLDIEHCIVGRPASTLANIATLYSIPVATAQCHEYLRTTMPNVDVQAANSTAEAAKMVSDGNDPTLAAIAPRSAAALYGLEVLADNVADHGGNQTRRRGVPTRRRTGKPDFDPARVRCPSHQPVATALAANQTRWPRRLLLHHVCRRTHH